jgi:hypothetical protein
VTEKDKEVLLSEISVQPVLPQGTAKVSVGKVETTEGK